MLTLKKGFFVSFLILTLGLCMISLYTSELFQSILPARIGYIIRQKRELLNLTQDQLAKRTHFSKYMISKIERGKHDLKLTELERISFGLESSIKVIIAEI